MDAQTIGIIVAIAGVGVAIIAIFVPLYLSLGRRIDRLSDQLAETNRLVAALANHRHADDGAATFILPAD